MNLANALKLRAALQACPPRKFDYRSATSRCGCVIPIFEGAFKEIAMLADVELGITSDEMDYLFGQPDATAGPTRDTSAKPWNAMTRKEATGLPGLTEALRRLDLILARHGYQPDGTPREQA